jgi:hypothetical protein
MKLVTADGRYHGDVANIEEARSVHAKAKYENSRVLSDEDWLKVTYDPSRRAELFSTLGQAL